MSHNDYASAVTGLLLATEAHVCHLAGTSTFEDYLDAVQKKAGGGTCSAVWTAGAIAYRCRTCQTSAYSAVCPECFKAGGHEKHDYILYRSPAGGCCDCGDLSSWRLEGCCPAHKPQLRQDVAAVIPPTEAAFLREAVQQLFEELLVALQPPRTPQRQDTSMLLLIWLQRLCKCGPCRSLAAHQICLPYRPPPFAPLGPSQHPLAPPFPPAAAANGAAPPAPPVASVEVQEARAMVDQCRTPDGSVYGHAQEGWAGVQLVQRAPMDLRRALAVVSALEKGGGQGGGADGRGVVEMGLVKGSWKAAREQPHDSIALRLLVALLISEDTRQPMHAQQQRGDQLQQITTLLLLLLYDLPFKMFCSAALVGVYLPTVAPPHLHPHGRSTPGLAGVLDRLNIHLFNVESVTVRLVHEHGLLEQVLGALQHALQHLRTYLLLPAAQAGDEPLHMRECQMLHHRILGDLYTIFNHPAAVQQLLGSRQTFSRLLHAIGTLQGLLQQRRVVAGDQAQYEPSHELALLIEINEAYLITNEILATLLGTHPCYASTMPLDGAATMQLLHNAARWAAECAQGWAAETAATEKLDTRLFWEALEAGTIGARFQLPLHRTAAYFIRALVAEEQKGGEQARHAGQLLKSLLGAGPEGGCGEGGRQQSAINWGLLARHVLLLQACVAQVEANTWARNGDDVRILVVQYQQLQRWHFPDADTLLLQLWLAACPPAEALREFLGAFGGAPLLEAAAAGAAVAVSAGMLQGVRRLVGVLRDREGAGLQPQQRVRRALLHWLAFKDMGYTKLTELLPPDLRASPHIDQVLEEIAEFLPPSLSQAGKYRLKKGSWRGLDPYYPHYTPHHLHRALERATDLGDWQPHWQLDPPPDPVPSIAPMLAVVTTPEMLHLVRHILTLYSNPRPSTSSTAAPPSSSAPPPPPPEEFLLAILALLSLSLHCLRQHSDALHHHPFQPPPPRPPRGRVPSRHPHPAGHRPPGPPARARRRPPAPARHPAAARQLHSGCLQQPCEGRGGLLQVPAGQVPPAAKQRGGSCAASAGGRQPRGTPPAGGRPQGASPPPAQGPAGRLPPPHGRPQPPPQPPPKPPHRCRPRHVSVSRSLRRSGTPRCCSPGRRRPPTGAGPPGRALPPGRAELAGGRGGAAAAACPPAPDRDDGAAASAAVSVPAGVRPRLRLRRGHVRGGAGAGTDAGGLAELPGLRARLATQGGGLRWRLPDSPGAASAGGGGGVCDLPRRWRRQRAWPPGVAHAQPHVRRACSPPAPPPHLGPPHGGGRRGRPGGAA